MLDPDPAYLTLTDRGHIKVQGIKKQFYIKGTVSVILSEKLAMADLQGYP